MGYPFIALIAAASIGVVLGMLLATNLDQKYDTYLYNCQIKHNVYKCSMQPDIGESTP